MKKQSKIKTVADSVAVAAMNDYANKQIAAMREFEALPQEQRPPPLSLRCWRSIAARNPHPKSRPLPIQRRRRSAPIQPHCSAKAQSPIPPRFRRGTPYTTLRLN